ncbi:hypothetical protein [Actinophytocola sp.]|uniref:hypothetical protein n=1 Tax=Actinophytocola sp. TaxID=1872138 RepID=UPI003D6AD123
MTTPELPALSGLTPVFAVTVLESEDSAAYLALRRFLRDALAERGRAHAVRVLGELLLTDPDGDVDGLCTVSDLGFDGLYVVVRQRWQSPRWTRSGPADLTHELTVALRRQRLVALHTVISGARLRRWARSGPYRFLPDTVLVAYDQASRGTVDVASAWSRLTTGTRLAFPEYLSAVAEALDTLADALVAEDSPRRL